MGYVDDLETPIVLLEGDEESVGSKLRVEVNDFWLMVEDHRANQGKEEKMMELRDQEFNGIHKIMLENEVAGVIIEKLAGARVKCSPMVEIMCE
ncbi:hypothetical protein Tco_0305549 [Tanacetum coccineum]